MHSFELQKNNNFVSQINLKVDRYNLKTIVSLKNGRVSKNPLLFWRNVHGQLDRLRNGVPVRIRRHRSTGLPGILGYQNIMFWCFDGSSPKLARLNLNNVDNNIETNNNNNNNNNNNDNNGNNNNINNNDDDDADDYSVFSTNNNGSVQTVGWNSKFLKYSLTN